MTPVDLFIVVEQDWHWDHLYSAMNLSRQEIETGQFIRHGILYIRRGYIPIQGSPNDAD